MRIDLAVYDRFHKLILAVEVKKKFGVSERWAAQTRRNLVVHGFYPLNSYFLLATPEKFFLWTPDRNYLEETTPNFVEDAEQQLKPHLNELGFKLREIDEYTFEQVVAHWLKYDIMYPMKNVTKPKWLVESGLAEKILHGNLSLEAIV
jgi:hypothetical protein